MTPVNGRKYLDRWSFTYEVMRLFSVIDSCFVLGNSVIMLWYDVKIVFMHILTGSVAKHIHI